MISTLVYNQAQKMPLAQTGEPSKAPYFFTEALAEKIGALPEDQQFSLRKELGMTPARSPTDRGLWQSWVDEAVWRLCFSPESLPELEKHRRVRTGEPAKTAPSQKLVRKPLPHSPKPGKQAS